ncbi:MAG: hypothetical protein ACRDJV_08475 [Actinomycetota bacterium]
MKKLKALWASLWGEQDRRIRGGTILGLLFVAVGFVVIGKAWDGAASVNFVQGQVPYLLSGGFMGLGMIVVGCLLVLLSAVRAERKTLTDQYERMSTLLGRNLSRLQVSTNGTSGEQVVAGDNVYHRPDCRILEGKGDLMTVALEQAASEGLEPCRVCEPPTVVAETSTVEAAAPSGGPETK